MKIGYNKVHESRCLMLEVEDGEVIIGRDGGNRLVLRGPLVSTKQTAGWLGSDCRGGDIYLAPVSTAIYPQAAGAIAQVAGGRRRGGPTHERDPIAAT